MKRRLMILGSIGIVLLIACGSARAGFLDDQAELQRALAELRSGIGERPRVLKIVVETRSVTIEAQDPRNRLHIDQWRYEIRPFRRSSQSVLVGPTAVERQLLDADLEANLFDLDAIDFSAASTLWNEAIKRAHLRDAAVVTRMEITRQTFIFPKKKAGDVRWSVQVSSGREHAAIYADHRGVIIGSDLSATQRAKSLNLLAEPAFVSEAARAFRSAIGSDRVLTKITIEAGLASFGTNIRDKTMNSLLPGIPSVASFTWNLDGLRQQLGKVDANALMNSDAAALSFGVDDVNWTVLDRLQADALARAGLSGARVASLSLEKSSQRPGGPALVWTVEIVDAEGEITRILANVDGAIEQVVLPESRRRKIDWLNPAALAGALARIGSTFGADVRIASISADERKGRITIEDPSLGGKCQTFDFAADGATRASISFSLDSAGARFGVADLSSFTEEKLATLESDALKRLAGGRKVYLESVRIGPHLFVQKAGARAIEIRVRNTPEDSARASYAWVVYDFNGRMLDMSGF